MVSRSSAEIADKWARRLKGATSDIASGIQKLTESPMEKAVAKKEKLKANWNRAVDSGIWERQTARYPLEKWKRDAGEVGVTRIASGVDKALDKYRDFATWLTARVQEGQAKIAKISDLTLEDRINRMVTFVRHMAEQKYKATK